MQDDVEEQGATTGGSVLWPVLQFALAGVVAVVIVVIATSIASGRVGEREAIVDARSQTLVRARDVVEPRVSDDLLESDPQAVAAVDTIVHQSVLDTSLIRVKIWRADGQIIYSDEARLIGTRYQLGAEELTSLAGGAVEAEVSDLSKPENRFERDQGKMLEVYLPIHTPNGTAVLFEAYFRYGAVVSSGSRVWRSFAPFTIGAGARASACSAARSTRRTSSDGEWPATFMTAWSRTSWESPCRSPLRPDPRAWTGRLLICSTRPRARCARASKPSGRC